MTGSQFQVVGSSSDMIGSQYWVVGSYSDMIGGSIHGTVSSLYFLGEDLHLPLRIFAFVWQGWLRYGATCIPLQYEKEKYKTPIFMNIFFVRFYSSVY